MITTLIEIVVLAVVQGIGEFLPISSSGHVVVVAAVFDQLGTPLKEKLSLNIVLHLGSLLAILAYYWPRILSLLGRDRRVIGLLLVGSLPAGVVGILYRAVLSPPLIARLGYDPLQSPMLVGFMFPLTGLLLLWAGRHPTGTLACRELSYRSALLIGLFQAVAILPGISRSGSTIAAGMFSGLKNEDAAAFSFLLAIPVLGGAGLLETARLVAQPATEVAPNLLLLGAGLSFAVSLASLGWLIRWLQQGRLHLFAWWVLLLGPIVVAWRLLSLAG